MKNTNKKQKTKYRVHFLIIVAIYLFYYSQGSVPQFYENNVIIPFWSMFKPSWSQNISLLILGGLAFRYWVIKVFVHKDRPNPNITYFAIITSTIYLIERLRFTSQFDFYGIKICGVSCAYFDIFFSLLPMLLIIWHLCYKAEKRSNANAIFTKDYVNKDNMPRDNSGRERFASEIAKAILAVQPENGAFSLGIEGDWGAGKSMLMGLIHKKLKDRAICISFNPWKINQPENIYKDFFNTLASELAQYNGLLKLSLLKYCDYILRDANSSVFQYIKGLFYFRGITSYSLFERINKEIEILKKPLVVFIDDLDRLQGNEILDVLRLVRNTSNFNNTCFVVAFEHGYLVESLTQINSRNHNYIEKIFQTVFHLPFVDPESSELFLKNIISEKFEYYLENKLDHEKEKRLSLFNYRITSILCSNKHSLVYGVLKNHRDYIRFSNQFIFHYQLMEECDFEFQDFFFLELLRYKFPEIVKWLIYRPDYFFQSDTSNIYKLKPCFVKKAEFYLNEDKGDSYIPTASLSVDSEGIGNKDDEHLRWSSRVVLPEDLVRSHDEKIVIRLLTKLFPSSNSHRGNEAIVIKSNYYRYLGLSVFSRDMEYYDFKNKVLNDEYEKNICQMIEKKNVERILNLFDRLSKEVVNYEPDIFAIQVERLIQAYKSYMFKNYESDKDQYGVEVENFLKKFVVLKMTSSRKSKLERVFLKCFSESRNPEYELNVFRTVGLLSSEVSRIGISFENLYSLTQQLFNDYTQKNSEIDFRNFLTNWSIVEKYVKDGIKPPSDLILREKFLTDYRSEIANYMSYDKSYEFDLTKCLIRVFSLLPNQTDELFKENISFWNMMFEDTGNKNWLYRSFVGSLSTCDEYLDNRRGDILTEYNRLKNIDSNFNLNSMLERALSDSGI